MPRVKVTKQIYHDGKFIDEGTVLEIEASVASRLIKINAAVSLSVSKPKPSQPAEEKPAEAAAPPKKAARRGKGQGKRGE